MKPCLYCSISKGKEKAKVVYYDDICIAFLNPMPSAPGHITLIPRKHYTIMEQVPDKEIDTMFKIASKLSTVAFETFGTGGTNIIINNGTGAGQKHPHFAIEIIPRNENDGMNFLWQPKKLSDEEMSTAELILKDQTENLSIGGEKPSEEVKELKTEKLKDDKDNYLMKSLKRIP